MREAEKSHLRGPLCRAPLRRGQQLTVTSITRPAAALFRGWSAGTLRKKMQIDVAAGHGFG